MRTGQAEAGQAVPNSAGTTRPALKVPANAADCHIHIFDQRFAGATQVLARGTVQDYRLLQKRNGTTRVVIVTPRPYVTDNRVTLDAIAQMGPDARGIAVLHPAVTDAELKTLGAGGIRGIRFAVYDPKAAAASIDMIEPLAQRIAGFGWHIQLHMSPAQIVDNAAMLRRLPTDVVFDHMGRLPPQEGIAHPAYGVIQDLLAMNKAWVKVSGAYLNTAIGPPGYADATAIARAYVAAAPERLLWGSDWPHPTEANHPPDDAALLDLLAEWAPDATVRNRILVTNPEKLYGFGSAA